MEVLLGGRGSVDDGDGKIEEGGRPGRGGRVHCVDPFESSTVVEMKTLFEEGRSVFLKERRASIRGEAEVQRRDPDGLEAREERSAEPSGQLRKDCLESDLLPDVHVQSSDVGGLVDESEFERFELPVSVS